MHSNFALETHRPHPNLSVPLILLLSAHTMNYGVVITIEQVELFFVTLRWQVGYSLRVYYQNNVAGPPNWTVHPTTDF